MRPLITLVIALFAASLCACGGSPPERSCEGAECPPADECVLGTHDCHEDALCTDTAEGFTCACADGFEGDGRTCADVDECAAGLDDCGALRTCANTAGGFECLCPPGTLDRGGECVQLAVGRSHACLLRDGALLCWGDNGSGQLGVGDEADRAAPTAVGDENDWIHVAAGYLSTCGIRRPGRLYCWGEDDARLGTPGALDTTVPNPVDAADDWASVSVGRTHACALKRDGRLFCWGDDAFGQLGNGDADGADHDVPQPIGGEIEWTQVAAGAFHTCGLTSEGEVLCWGSDNRHQLGNGDASSDEAHAPAPVPGVEGAALLGSGSESTVCVVTGSNALYCWGRNDYGQGGKPAAGDLPSRALVEGSFEAVGTGETTSCAIDVAGELHCFGRNHLGQRGVGDRDESALPPVSLGTGRTWWAVGAGADFVCGLAEGGGGRAEALCWGSNADGRLGIGAPITAVPPTRVEGEYVGVSAGLAHTCAIAVDHTAWCWGANFASATVGTLGTGSDHAFEQVPGAVEGGLEFLEVTAGQSYSCGIERLTHGDPGRLFCWGKNTYGNLGVGDEETRARPTQVGEEVGWQSVTAGLYHTCGIVGDALHCWGNGLNGQLGSYPAGGSSSTPLAVDFEGASAWTSVALGQFETCAAVEVNTKGGMEPSLRCFGAGWEGAITSIDEGRGWVLDGVSQAMCGIADPDGLHCWGSNASGQLGLGDFTGRDAPTPVSLAGVSALSVGSSNACALAPVLGRGAGLFCWGSNGAGQLGNGEISTPEPSPLMVGSALDWLDVSVGYRHACAVNEGHELYCWGENTSGQLGIGAAFRTTPSPVAE